MNLRRLAIRAMLVSLAFAAAAGILGVLVPGRDAVWRVVMTALATAIACGLMLSATKWIDRPTARAASLVSMAVIVVEFLLCVALIWGLGRLLPGPYDEEQIGLTMLWLALCGFPAVAFVRMTRSAAARVGGYVGVVAAGVTFLIAMVGLWMPGTRWWGDDKIIGTGACFGLFSLGAVLCLVGVGTDRRHWRWIGVLAAAVGCAMGLWGIWSRANNPGWPLAWVISVVGVVAHANVSMLAPLTRGQRWLRLATILSVIVTASLVDVIVYLDGAPEMLERLASAAGICAACGTLAIAILARANRKTVVHATPKELREIRLECPQCGKKQALPVGADAACGGCGLKITVQVTEPRCPTCDYLLYGLRSERCPECGTLLENAAPAGAIGSAVAAPQ
jgi:rRNA maturation protein Nop10